MALSFHRNTFVTKTSKIEEFVKRIEENPHRVSIKISRTKELQCNSYFVWPTSNVYLDVKEFSVYVISLQIKIVQTINYIKKWQCQEWKTKAVMSPKNTVHDVFVFVLHTLNLTKLYILLVPLRNSPRTVHFLLVYVLGRRISTKVICKNIYIYKFYFLSF